jgi:hypothetical protein
VRVTQPAAPQRALAGTSLSSCQRAGDTPRVRRALVLSSNAWWANGRDGVGLRRLAGRRPVLGPKLSGLLAGRRPDTGYEQEGVNQTLNAFSSGLCGAGRFGPKPTPGRDRVRWAAHGPAALLTFLSAL